MSVDETPSAHVRPGPCRVTVLGHELECRCIGPPPEAARTVVFLHEGLGSVSLWRDFPDRLLDGTGFGGLVYSRAGYGASSSRPGPWPVEFMHHEALAVLPTVLAACGIRDPILFGHSDGGSIALLHAAAFPGAVHGLILEAAHVFVEDVCVARIGQLAEQSETSAVRRGLARHHGANAGPLFAAWTGVWLRPEFRSWNIAAALPAVRCPTLVLQGEDDEYGTARQVEAIAEAVSGPVETALLAGCGHAPHVERPEPVLALARRFLRALTR